MEIVVAVGIPGIGHGGETLAVGEGGVGELIPFQDELLGRGPHR